MLKNLLFILFILFNNVANGQDCFTIVNNAKIDYTQDDLNNLIAICNKVGITKIEKVIFGITFLPGGLQPNLLTVYEKPTILGGYDVTQRFVEIECIYWRKKLSFDTTSSTQFRVQQIDTSRTWLVFLQADTIKVWQHSTITYRQVKKVLSLIKQNQYVFKFNNHSYSPHDDIMNVGNVDFVDNHIQVSYDFNGQGYTIVCDIKKNLLEIVDLSTWIN